MIKHQKYIILILITIVFLSVSCDRVEQPIIPIIGYDLEKYGIPPSFDPATEEMKIQRVVIEDFTGHQCGNCPEAAIVAEDIKTANPGKISIIAIHAGDFTDISDDYPEDWTSGIGDFLWSNIPNQFNPGGRINRSPISNSLHLHTNWTNLTNEQLALSPKVVIQIAHFVQQEDNVVNIHIFTEMLENYDGNLKMVAYLTESELVGNQLDYANTPQHIDDYDFEFVLRDAINGNVGVNLGEDLEAGVTVQKDYSYVYNTTWNIQHCHVIAVVYDEESGNIINSFEINID